MKSTFQVRAALGALVLLPFLLACNKDPGEGGRAEIRGIVYEQRYNASTGLPIGNKYPVADERVSIIYGDGEYADDDTRTEPDGRYRFPWLRKGSYQVYVISECNTYADCVTAIYRSVDIGGRKEVVGVDTIIIANY